jgi:hypothetical protein
LNKNVLTHLFDMIPGALDLKRAPKQDDKNGTDYWLLRTSGLPPVSIDMKNRDFCPIERFGSDDACIEIVSQYMNGFCWKTGWTLDETKRTDLIIYTWPHAGGRRFWVVYFPILCQAATLNWQTWRDRFHMKAAHNRDYDTLSIFPPRHVIAQAMRALTEGVR